MSAFFESAIRLLQEQLVSEGVDYRYIDGNPFVGVTLQASRYKNPDGEHNINVNIWPSPEWDGHGFMPRQGVLVLTMVDVVRVDEDNHREVLAACMASQLKDKLVKFDFDPDSGNLGAQLYVDLQKGKFPPCGIRYFLETFLVVLERVYCRLNHLQIGEIDLPETCLADDGLSLESIHKSLMILGYDEAEKKDDRLSLRVAVSIADPDYIEDRWSERVFEFVANFRVIAGSFLYLSADCTWELDHESFSGLLCSLMEEHKYPDLYRYDIDDKMGTVGISLVVGTDGPDPVFLVSAINRLAWVVTRVEEHDRFSWAYCRMCESLEEKERMRESENNEKDLNEDWEIIKDLLEKNLDEDENGST